MELWHDTNIERFKSRLQGQGKQKEEKERSEKGGE